MPSRGAETHEPGAFVIEFGGNGSRAEYMIEYVAEQWGDRPVEVWSVNYPGYGQSAGSAKLVSIAPAALAVFDAARAKAGNRPIFICGHSIGTTAALYLAAHRPVAGLVLHNPPPLRQLIVGKYGWWNLWLAAGPVALGVPGELDSLANGRHATAPAIFILAGADRMVPPRFQQRVVEAYAGPKQLVRLAGADHNDPVDGPEHVELEACLDRMWGSVVERRDGFEKK